MWSGRILPHQESSLRRRGIGIRIRGLQGERRGARSRGMCADMDTEAFRNLRGRDFWTAV